jgi:lysozyme
MLPEVRQKLKNLLVKHIEYRQFPYVDINSNLIVGLGRNLSKRGISTSEAFPLLEDDIFYFNSKLDYYFDFFRSLSDNRKCILIVLCFDLGINGLLEYPDMLEAIQTGDYEKAAVEIMNSKAAQNKPDNYHNLAYVMRTDELE